ncbi:MAG: glycosyltransferase family 2 protein [Chthoniobacteraceae bacterium]
MTLRAVATISILFHVLILVALGFAVLTMLANLATFRSLVPADPPAEAPLVSILVPARNEALNIGPCVKSLLAQNYPNFELLVLDDHSTDGTGDILRELCNGPNGARLRVIKGADLPAGWVGKNWACHQLAQTARGEWLFFTDADTEHAPGTVSATLGAAQESGASLLSAWPRLITKTWAECLVVPMIAFFAMAFYPHWLVVRLQRSRSRGARIPVGVRRQLGVANGQFMFWSRVGYDRIGGHQSVHNHLVEDVALGREVAARMDEGMRLHNCDSLPFSTCRMYRSFSDVWEGFSKNARAIFEDRPDQFFRAGAVGLICLFWPFVAIFLPGSHRMLAGIEISLIYLLRFVISCRFRTSWLGALAHPFGFLLGTAIAINSWRRSRGAGVSWKGRVYPVALGGKS